MTNAILQTAIRLWTSLPSLVRAPAAGVTIALGGPLTWVALSRLNQRLLPNVPWSAALMLAFIGLALRYFDSAAWSAANSRRCEALRRLWPAAPTPEIVVLIVSATVLSLSMIFISLRIGNFSKESFGPGTNLRTLSPFFAYSMVITAALVAGFFEELGLRGFMQQPLEKRFGPVSAIGMTSFLFYALHLHHGWARGDLVTVLAVAVPFLVASSVYGAIAFLTESIGPCMVVHSLTDLAALPLEWQLVGSYNLSPVASTGIDLHFAICFGLLVISASVVAGLLFRLTRRRASSREDHGASVG